MIEIKKDNIVAIDVLKTIAILMVIIVHIGQPLKNLPYIIDKAFEFGQMGVQIFFMISAYLLLKFYKPNEGNKTYFIKKLLRIAPSYYLAIIIYEVLFILLSTLKLPIRIETNTNLLDILSNVFFVNIFNRSGYNNVVPGGWSISCLVVFYALFPIFFREWKHYSIKKSTVFASVICVICIACSILISVIFNLSAENNTFWYYSVINQLPAFIVGLWVCNLHINKPEQIRSKFYVFLILAIIFSGGGILIFYLNFPFAFALMPLIASLAGGAWLLFLDSVNLKEIKIVKQISASTLEILIIHPLFVYYGIGYTYKAIEILKLNVLNAVIIICSIIFVIVFSVLLSILLNKITKIPSVLYKNSINKNINKS